MNKKGFTLIELLAVISILALIAMIVFPAINTAIKNAEEDAYNNQVKVIENAAKEWALDNVDKLPDTEGGKYQLEIEELKNYGYISEEDVKDPRDTSKDLEGVVIITYTKNQYTYKYEDKGSSGETAASWLLENASDKDILKANNGVYKGSSAQNYLTFSGKSWRILNVNSNGTIKAIMSTDATALPFDSQGKTAFSNSSVYTYLNNTFLNTLNNNNIEKASYCTGSIDDPCSDTTLATVSLPSIDDYVNASNKQGCKENNSLCSEGTYLNLDNTCLSNTNNSGVYTIKNGNVTLASTASSCNIRPVVTLSSETTLEGSGTSKNPFVVN